MLIKINNIEVETKNEIGRPRFEISINSILTNEIPNFNGIELQFSDIEYKKIANIIHEHMGNNHSNDILKAGIIDKLEIQYKTSHGNWWVSGYVSSYTGMNLNALDETEIQHDIWFRIRTAKQMI